MTTSSAFAPLFLSDGNWSEQPIAGHQSSNIDQAQRPSQEIMSSLLSVKHSLRQRLSMVATANDLTAAYDASTPLSTAHLEGLEAQPPAMSTKTTNGRRSFPHTRMRQGDPGAVKDQHCWREDLQPTGSGCQQQQEKSVNHQDTATKRQD